MTNPISNSLAALLPPTPKLIKGRGGAYWQVAANDTGAEIYLKFRFDPMPVSVNGSVTPVDGLQVNVMYIGDQFDIPLPYKFLEARPYIVDDKQVQGFIIGSIHIPMGEFNKNLLAMHEYVLKNLLGPLHAALLPLYAAAQLTPTLALDQLWALMMEGLQSTPMTVEPQVLICEQYIEYSQKLKAGAQAKFTPKPEASDSADKGSIDGN